MCRFAGRLATELRYRKRQDNGDLPKEEGWEYSLGGGAAYAVGQYWTTSGCMWADGNGGVSVGCYYGVHGSIFSICSTSWKLEEDWHVCKFRTDRSVDPKIESEKGTNETWVFEKKKRTNSFIISANRVLQYSWLYVHRKGTPWNKRSEF